MNEQQNPNQSNNQVGIPKHNQTCPGSMEWNYAQQQRYWQQPCQYGPCIQQNACMLNVGKSSTCWHKKMRGYFMSLVFGTALGVILGGSVMLFVSHLWIHPKRCKYGVVVPMQARYS